MKTYVAALAVALGVAAVAFLADSPILLLVSVLLIAGATVGIFVVGVRAAQQAEFVTPFVASLAVALVVAAIGVTSIVVGERGDAPGLVLLGIVVIVAVITTVYAFGLRTAQRPR